MRPYPIDIVPFGKIEKNGQIAWPPDNDPEMNVVGFQEMYNHSEELDIDDDIIQECDFDLELAGGQIFRQLRPRKRISQKIPAFLIFSYGKTSI